MNQQRKLVLKMGAGIVTLLGAAIAIAAAHDVSELRDGKVVKSASDSSYQYTVREAPIKPNEPIRGDGTFPSGYYYTCTVLKGGLPISSYTVCPRIGYHADAVKIEPLILIRRHGLMTCFEFEGANPEYYEAICRYIEPDEKDMSHDFRWQVASQTDVPGEQ